MMTGDKVLRKIYLSLYWKGCVWEGVGDRTELQYIDPHSIGHNRISFPFSWAAQSGACGPASLGAGFLYCILSPTRLIPQINRGSRGALLPGSVFSTVSFLQHSDLQNWLNFLCTELYNSSTPTQSLPITDHRNMHFCCLWNGLFYRHRAEITVMQFTGHFLPVRQFLTAPWDFNLVPYCQPSSPTPMEYALPPSLEWHVWRGRRSIYYIATFPQFIVLTITPRGHLR